VLDVDFYGAYYPDLAGWSPEALLEHWKAVGRNEGRHGNASAALDAVIDDPGLPDGFDIAAYLAINPDVRASTRWDVEAVAHYLTYGVKEGRRFSFSHNTPRIVSAPRTHDAKQSGPNETQSVDAPQKDAARLHFGNLLKRAKRGAGSPIAGRPDLPADFNPATYQARYRDVAAANDSPDFAITHYLAHGAAEGRTGAPRSIDRNFIRDYYGVELAPDATVADALRKLRGRLGKRVRDLLFVDERELCNAAGLRSAVFRIHFDPDFYALAFSPETRPVGRTACLRHFCETGQFEARDISTGWRFDPQFYAQQYRPEGAADRKALFRHWVEKGVREGAWPNLALLLNARHGLEFPASVVAALDKIASLAWPGRKFDAPADRASALVADCRGALAYLDLGAADVADFVTRLADRFSTVGDAAAADWVYQAVIAAAPHLSRARRHHADLVNRGGFPGAAAQMRRDLIARGQADQWAYLQLGEYLKQVGQGAQAIETFQAGVVAFPEQYGLRERVRREGYEWLGATFGRAQELAANLGVEVAVGTLARALELATPHGERAAAGRSIRHVAIYGSFHLPQCRFYRVDLKAEHLRAAGYEVSVFDPDRQTDEFVRALPTIDFVIVHRVAAFPHVIEALSAATAHGIATAYDIDDLIFDTAHYPPPLESYGGQIDHKTHLGLACGAPMFAQCMSLCDYGIASTRSLKAFMEPHVRTGVVFVAPNALSSRHMRRVRPPRAPQSNVTIFYGSATKAHKQEFVDIVEPALSAIARKYGAGVRIVLIGDMTLSEQFRRSGVEILVAPPLGNVDDYWEYLSAADINLSVLERSASNDCKSEIKWLEAGMMAIPSVVSRVATHEDVVEDGVTGFLCSNSAEFAKALDTLVGDANLRRRIGLAAQAAILERYSVERQAALYRDMIARIESDRPAPKQRLAIVNVFYPPQAIGGATRVVHDNVRDLQRILGPDWGIDVICTLEGGPRPYERICYVQDGVRVFAITAADRGDIDQITEDRRMGEAFGACLDEIKPDLVHFHCIQRLTLSAVDQTRDRNIPYFVTMHDGWWISPNQFIVGPDDREELLDLGRERDDDVFGLSLRGAAMRRALRGTAKILTVSASFAAVLRRAGLRDVTVTENGVSALTPLPRSPSPTGRVRLAHVGGAMRHKGLHLVRSVLNATPFTNLSLLLVDHAFEAAERRKETWGTTPVEIRSKTKQKDIAQLYAEIDVLLAPSIWPESFGLVAREAAACGCWVIASDRGAIGENLTAGENGFIVDVSTPSALQKALMEIDANPERFRTAPSATPDLRPAPRQAEQLAELYRALVATQESSPD
jgi:glycosyltransferase involved in cell wall biosynthesis